MPVHNALPFLHESIRSIVNQTFGDFEFLILNDACTDGSVDVMRDWERRDKRIRIIHSKVKLGLAGSANMVVANAPAPVIARMDADDVSHPERLKRQWQVLQTDQDVVAVGTLCDGIDAAGRTVRPRDRWRLVRTSRYIPFPHGSAMFRRDAFDKVKGYSDRLTSGEDQDLFFRMALVGRVVTLPDLLYHFRYHTLNSTLLTGAEAVHAAGNGQSQNGEELAALYMLGAMRLWAGERPAVLPQLIDRRVLHWNLKSLFALSSGAMSSVSPATLRFLLRRFIRVRDGLVGLRIKDGRPYDWRFK